MIEAEAPVLTLFVSDLGRSLAFYRDRLGFAVKYGKDPHFWMLEKDGFLLGLHPGSAYPPSRRFSVGLRVTDLRREVATLRAEGVGVPDDIVEEGGLLRVDFEDPDGNALYLVQMLARATPS